MDTKGNEWDDQCCITQFAVVMHSNWCILWYRSENFGLAEIKKGLLASQEILPQARVSTEDSVWFLSYVEHVLNLYVLLQKYVALPRSKSSTLARRFPHISPTEKGTAGVDVFFDRPTSCSVQNLRSVHIVQKISTWHADLGTISTARHLFRKAGRCQRRRKILQVRQ